MAILGRNDKCPCGSAKKYKKCCIDKEILKFENPKTHINLDDVKN
ncbi:SEC-C domain-containing protein [Halanaerobium sp. Z-7514]|uniref:SEC-C domain-containing protein n=1 Tax=Halanaerobium polyolivorans TaxID=2886943 RepID=A0AAW4X061_9FIRM|nr:SEC-C metal-binding domain-containing protein [Halanaerobium polyolivorans]MCC3145126.1 SEC-C domain-containing protein [Halanaerobium polyolivorans]